jgi:hypothetical protein
LGHKDQLEMMELLVPQVLKVQQGIMELLVLLVHKVQ